MKRFLYYYIRSMRLYYGFVTGTTVLWGILHANPANYAPCTRSFSQLDAKAVAALIVGFLAWGVNQIFSDYLDRKEDAVNAPHRPMVTGALAAKPALVLSSVLMVLIGVVSLWISPWALGVLCVGGVLNLAYSRVKSVPVLNVVMYGCAISCCALYGVAAVQGDLRSTAPEPLEDVMDVAFFVLPVHILMCHNSYYKDVAGDRAAGVRTLQTLFPMKVSLVATILLAWGIIILPLLGLLVLQYRMPWSLMSFALELKDKGITYDHGMPLMLVQLALEILLALLLVFNLKKHRYHRVTCLNCQLCVSMLYPWMSVYHTLLVVIRRFCNGYEPERWMLDGVLLAMELLSLAIIQLLFLWYRDEKE